MRLAATLIAILLPHSRHFSFVLGSSIPPSPSSYPTNSTTQSGSPTWSVLNLQYHRINLGTPCVGPAPYCGSPFGGGQPSALYYGELPFDIANKVTNVTHHCDLKAMYLSDLVAADETWLPCREGLLFIMVPEYVTDTMFRFNHSSNTLELNQTWMMPGEQGRNVTAYGRVSPVLDTMAEYVGNRDLGEVSVQGVSPDIDVEGTVVAES